VHYAPTQFIAVKELVSELLEMAAKVLCVGGRLVFLYPINRADFHGAADDLPKHERLQLVDFSENQLSLKRSRILITMHKTH